MIYLDDAASTRVHPNVLEAMLPFLKEQYGNPSSIHASGRLARKAINKARRHVAALINADPSEIFFTSGGTESNNTALCMMRAAGRGRQPCRIITSTIEHDAVLEPCKQLAQDGIISAVDYLPVDGTGMVDIGRLADLLKVDLPQWNVSASACVTDEDGRTLRTERQESLQSNHELGDLQTSCLVSIMYANNEVGTIQPVKTIAWLCRCARVLFHTDAVQAAGKIPVDVKELGVDMMSVSSHKIYGPKGVGALYVRKGICLPPFVLGGGQETGMRSGTENVAGIVGFGTACKIAREHLAENMLHARSLRDRLAGRVLAEIPYSTMNGNSAMRLPGNTHFTFLGVNGEDLLIKLDEHGVAASTGSACSVNTQKASHVLQAMGFSHEQITGSLRVTVGRFNTAEDVDYAVDVLKRVVNELRTVSPFRAKYSFTGATKS